MTTGSDAHSHPRRRRRDGGGGRSSHPAQRINIAKRSFQFRGGRPSRENLQFWVLSAFLVAMFAMAGSRRIDTESIMVVRPLSAVVLGFGLSSLTWSHVKAYRWLFVVAVACVAVALVQLVPLSAKLAYGLPGHAVIADIDLAAGNYGHPHPISMVPTLTRNALWSMLVPLAVLVLGVQLSAAQQSRWLPLLILIGIASATLGVLQILGNAKGALYIFQYSDVGLPVGLFANRNHQAVFLATMLPMLAVWWRTDAPSSRVAQSGMVLMRPLGASVLGAILLLIILLTGSRSGMALAVLACVSVPLVLYKRGARARSGRLSTVSGRWFGKSGRIVSIAILAITASIVLAAVLLNRALSLDRLFANNIGEDMRLQVLPVVKSIVAEFWPLGSGLDSFVDIFRMHETTATLVQKSMNNAHDDWLETLVTAGAPGAVVLILVTSLWLSRLSVLIKGWNASHPAYRVRLGFVIFLIYALASFTDYHLQDGSIDCLIVVVSIWMVSGQSAKEVPLSDVPESQRLAAT